MVNPWFRNTKAIILTPLLLVLLFIVACGTTTPPTSAPAPTSPVAPSDTTAA